MVYGVFSLFFGVVTNNNSSLLKSPLKLTPTKALIQKYLPDLSPSGNTLLSKIVILDDKRESAVRENLFNDSLKNLNKINPLPWPGFIS